MADKTISVCGRCGARRGTEPGKCALCGCDADWRTLEQAGLTRSVHDAAEAWARSVSGAPRSFAELIVEISPRDELLERVVTEIVRRDVHEQRLPSNRRDLEPPRLNPATVDPFEVSLAELRAQSEHIAPCNGCNGAGLAVCQGCGGTRRAACSACDGTGKTLKYYKTTTRLINCKVCRAAGTVKCGSCGAAGSVACPGCAGSGHQVSWLTYHEQSYIKVRIEPDSAVTRAHPQLSEERFLSPSELEAFAVLSAVEARGPIEIEGYRQEHPILKAVAVGIDARRERIHRQQYHRLSIVRRDARFQLCGGQSTLVLSGRDLDAATTPGNTALFRRRRNTWISAATLIAVASSVFGSHLLGSAPYFHRANQIVVGLILFGATILAVAIGAVLRALRPQLGFGPLTRLEKRSLLGGALCLVLAPLAAWVERPRVGEVTAALRAKELPRAREIVGALIETQGDTGDVAEADDEVSLAEATQLSGEQRLRVLDRVSARHGARSTEAAAAAREERLSILNRLLDERRPAEVLTAVDRWWPEPPSADGEVAEVRARAHEMALAGCETAPCRYHEAAEAAQASPTDHRRDALAKMRGELLDALSTADVPNESTLDRLRRLRALSAVANGTSRLAANDRDLNDAAGKAATWASSERAKMPLIGADLPTVEELLGKPTTTDAHGVSVVLDTNRVFFVLDAAKRCRGIYAVGEKEGARQISTAWADAFVSQSTGHPTTVRHPTADSPTQMRWFDVNAMITARWRDTSLVELRIGDAAP